MKTETPIYNLTEASEHWRTPKRTIRNLVKRGLWPAIKVTNKIILFNRDEVNRALKKLTINAA